MKNETKSIIIANTTQNIKKEKRIEKFLKENNYYNEFKYEFDNIFLFCDYKFLFDFYFYENLTK